MAVPKQHRSSSRRDQRRMHIRLTAPRFGVCPQCSKPALPHRVCANCGYYRGRKVLDVTSKIAKKELRNTK